MRLLAGVAAAAMLAACANEPATHATGGQGVDTGFSAGRLEPMFRALVYQALVQ